MATINLGRVMFQLKGAWSGATAYVKDDIVTYNGNSYICLKDNTGVTPIRPTGKVEENLWAIFQEGFTWKGAWTNGVEYFPNDIVRFKKSSYICKKRHTAILDENDPRYNPYNEWDEFVHGGEGRAFQRVSMLNSRGPIGWGGHPFISKPVWTGGLTWNGNIPNNIPAAAKKWYWNNPTGHCRTTSYVTNRFVNWSGRLMQQGTSSSNSMGASNTTIPTATVADPSWMRDYWHDENPTFGFKSAYYRNDSNASMPTVVQVVSGLFDCTVLYSNGSVVRQGIGTTGASGVGTNTNASAGSYQVNFPPGTFIVKIAASCEGSSSSEAGHFLALDAQGFLWSWGNNTFGQLGLGNEQAQGKVIGMVADARTDTSATGSYRGDELAPKRIPKFAFDNKRIVDCWAFGSNAGVSYALDEAGVLWSWGCNTVGQVGYPTNTGFRHTDGSTVPFIWGRGIAGFNWNTYNGIQKIVFNSADNTTSSAAYILDGTGRVWWCGFNPGGVAAGNNSTTTNTTNAGNPIQINFATGTLNNAVHNIWSVGNNDEPNIYVRRNDGQTWGWGFNNYRQLTNGTTTNSNTPIQILGVTNALTITGGGADSYNYHAALCLDANGRVRIFGGGYNGYGVLGFGDDTTDHATGGSQAAASGSFHRVSGSGQFWWQPMYTPAGENRTNQVRDIQMFGNAQYQNCQILFEDGTIMLTGINWLNTTNRWHVIYSSNNGQAFTMRKPDNSY
jgi:alpha-tubulin suppressor-like RCC1 family protein